MEEEMRERKVSTGYSHITKKDGDTSLTEYAPDGVKKA